MLNPYAPAEYTPTTLDGFETTQYPHWVIQRLVVDMAELVEPVWFDADYSYYNPDQDINGNVGGINFTPLSLDPENLTRILTQLRTFRPDMQWRMCIRFEVEKALDI